MMATLLEENFRKKAKSIIDTISEVTSRCGGDALALYVDPKEGHLRYFVTRKWQDAVLSEEVTQFLRQHILQDESGWLIPILTAPRHPLNPIDRERNRTWKGRLATIQKNLGDMNSQFSRFKFFVYILSTRGDVTKNATEQLQPVLLNRRMTTSTI
jgi:hypothetical protein